MVEEGRGAVARVGVSVGSAACSSLKTCCCLAFRFSRFDATAAPVRNVSALTGSIGMKHHHVHPGHESAG